jgi:peptide/nickel transport system substrate-binding protein
MLQRAAVLTLAAFAVLAAGCTKVSEQATTGAGNSWTTHGVLRWAGLSEPDNMNPVVGNQQIETDLSMFWGGYLLNWSDDNKFVPELATEEPTLKNGGISKDGLTITYHLRRGVQWQDGAPFTVDDVVYTYQQIMNKANNVPSTVGYDVITGTETPDKYTLIVHLKKKFTPFVASFFTMSSTPYPVLPKHLLAKYTAAPGGNINKVPFDNLPVGTGPFKVVSYEHGALIRMVANPHYWRGAPKLREVDYHIVPNENTILTQLEAHDADFEYNAPAAQYDSVAKLANNGYQLYKTPFTQYAQLALNLQNPILADVNVRRALAYVTSTKEIIDKVTHGVEMQGYTDQPPFLWAYNDNITKYDYDPAKAGQLLDQAGWTMGADGYRHKNGQILELTLSGSTGAATNNAIEVVVQAEWKKAGVKATIKNYQTGLFFATFGAGGILQTGKFDVGIYSWINGVDPDDSTLWMCDQFPPKGQNTYHFCDPQLDAAEQIALTDYDPAHRKAAYATIQKILADQEPMIVLYYSRRLDPANTDLKGYKPAHAVSEFWNTWEWSI